MSTEVSAERTGVLRAFAVAIRPCLDHNGKKIVDRALRDLDGDSPEIAQGTLRRVATDIGTALP